MIVLGKDKNNIILKECPVSYISDWSRDMHHLFQLTHAAGPSLGGPMIIPGPLPSSGGVYDQDNATMEAFEVIKNEVMTMWEKPKKGKK